jgi:hypothetical protein
MNFLSAFYQTKKMKTTKIENKFALFVDESLKEEKR